MYNNSEIDYLFIRLLLFSNDEFLKHVSHIKKVILYIIKMNSA